MNRSATASLHSATPKKNVLSFSDMAVVNLFLKKEGLGSLPAGREFSICSSFRFGGIWGGQD